MVTNSRLTYTGSREIYHYQTGARSNKNKPCTGRQGGNEERLTGAEGRAKKREFKARNQFVFYRRGMPITERKQVKFPEKGTGGEKAASH